jgi:hypothetical protein
MLPLLLLGGLAAVVVVAAVASAGAKGGRFTVGKLVTFDAFEPGSPVFERTIVPVDRTGEKAWEEKRAEYEQVPVIGPMFVGLMDTIVDTIGFAASTARQDLADMASYQRWYIAISKASDDVYKRAIPIVAELERKHGKARVLALALPQSEVVTIESIKTGIAVRLPAVWYSSEGWGAWWNILRDDLLKSLPVTSPTKGWHRYHNELGDRYLRATRTQAGQAVDRLTSLAADLAA